MRERLIELCREAQTKYLEEEPPVGDFGKYLADHLLANGVVVPPSKVGEKIYIHQFDNKLKKVVECEIIEHNEAEELFKVKLTDGRILTLIFQFIGKTVFLTRGEAEAKLKEGVK